MQRWIRALVPLLCGVLLVAAWAMAETDGGSWSQINQELTAPDGWERIVQNSAFQLGEKTASGGADGPTYFRTYNVMGYGTYPSLDGSTVAVPMALEFARQHLSLTEDDLTGFVFFSTTHSAYEHLILRKPNGSAMIPSENAAMDDTRPVDLIIVTEPSDEELALAAENGVTLVKKPVCYDAFVFITHADNPVQSLTVEQIQKIYSGEITNWKEVGGADSSIIPYQREANSGSQTAMENLVMQGMPLSAAEENYVTGSMEGLVRRVGDYEDSAGSLGYTYKYYLDTLYKSDTIKILAIDGVAPTDENLRGGAYAFTTNYYGVIRAGEENSAGGLFLNWMLSPEGQRCIRQAGYIPVTEP